MQEACRRTLCRCTPIIHACSSTRHAVSATCCGLARPPRSLPASSSASARLPPALAPTALRSAECSTAQGGLVAWSRPSAASAAASTAYSSRLIRRSSSTAPSPVQANHAPRPEPRGPLRKRIPPGGQPSPTNGALSQHTVQHSSVHPGAMAEGMPLARVQKCGWAATACSAGVQSLRSTHRCRAARRERRMRSARQSACSARAGRRPGCAAACRSRQWRPDPLPPEARAEHTASNSYCNYLDSTTLSLTSKLVNSGPPG